MHKANAARCRSRDTKHHTRNGGTDDHMTLVALRPNPSSPLVTTGHAYSHLQPEQLHKNLLGSSGLQHDARQTQATLFHVRRHHATIQEHDSRARQDRPRCRWTTHAQEILLTTTLSLNMIDTMDCNRSSNGRPREQGSCVALKRLRRAA